MQITNVLHYMYIIVQQLLFVFQFEGKLDSVHLELVRGIGLLLLMWALSYWLLSKSTDSTIDTSFLWTQAIVSGTIKIMKLGHLKYLL